MKNISLSILMIFAIVLTACGSLSTGTPTGSTTSNELPIEAQLVIGTLNLGGTEQDVTEEQAQELSILWKVYEEISQSDTAAQDEIDGLIEQIQESMTTKQMQAITNMQLTQQDVFTATQGLAVASSSSQSDSSSVASPSGDMAGAPPDGGGAPPDGSSMPADFGGAGSTTSTGQAQDAQASLSLESSAGVPSALVEALIQSLEQKIAS